MRYRIPKKPEPTRQQLALLDTDAQEVISILVDDVQKCCDKINKNPYDESSARAAIRNYIALIEAILYFMKQLTLIKSGLTGYKLIPKDEESLKGKRFEIRRGKKREIPIQMKFLEDVKFTLRIFSKVLGLNFQINFEHPGWQKLNTAKEIRHRLTHPIKGADLKVSRQDYDDVSLAAKWFLEQQRILMVETRKQNPEKMDFCRCRLMDPRNMDPIK